MRLTYDKNGTEPKIYDCDFLDNSKCIQKLGQLEDIEQELGIDLITLFKLVKSKKIYSFGHDNIMENSISGINIYDNTITIWNGYCHSNYPLSEYGKSFALTKEELKKWNTD